MKNYIILYAAIIVFVIGGIKGTSYIIEKEKKEELETINFHVPAATLLLNEGEVLPAETANKNIVIYSLYLNTDTAQTNYLKLNELANKYASSTGFYLASRIDSKEYVENFFKKQNLVPVFKTLYKTRQITYYIESLKHYFYTKEESDQVAGRLIVPTMLVISNTGKIKLYKIGNEKDMMDQVEAALKQ